MLNVSRQARLSITISIIQMDLASRKLRSACHGLAMDASTSSAPRRVLKTTSDADRQHVLSAYEKGTPPSEISRLLNVKKSTVYGIIRRYKDTWQMEAKKRGGNRAKLLPREAVDSIRDWIEEDCTVTLKTLGEKIFQQYGIRASRSTIANEIKDLKSLKNKSTDAGTTSYSNDD
uniref:Paired domain-containing protein n=1 Tax=Anopheles maculatus TaxID=74869 RepID=A0A182SU47_9DIPT